MHTNRIAVATLLVMALATGCRRPPEAVSDGGAATASAPAVGPLRSDEARELCLADPGGDGAIERELRAAQERARRLAQKSDEWVSAGRQWVRKARLASDPGFYVNVEGCAAAALNLEPDLASALELRGLALMNDHRFEQARESAEQVLRADPESV